MTTGLDAYHASLWRDIVRKTHPLTAMPPKKSLDTATYPAPERRLIDFAGLPEAHKGTPEGY